MARKKKTVGGGAQEVNMTPMIDCTFQLIIFFILTAKMASDELAKVCLPQPVHSQAKTGDEEGSTINMNDLPGKIVVNVVNKYGDKDDKRNAALSAKATKYKMADKDIDPGDTETLITMLKKRRSDLLNNKDLGIKPKDVMVEIRADKDIEFLDIEPVMLAAASAKITKISMTALTDTKN